MTDPAEHTQCKGALLWALMVVLIFGIPLTGGLIIPIGLLIWGAVALKKRRQAAYDDQVRRQKQDDDAAYGRRMRGY